MLHFNSNDYHQLEVHLYMFYDVDEIQFRRFWEIIDGGKWNNNTVLYYNAEDLYFDKEMNRPLSKNKSFMDNIILCKDPNYMTDGELRALDEIECKKCNRRLRTILSYGVYIITLLITYSIIICIITHS